MTISSYTLLLCINAAYKLKNSTSALIRTLRRWNALVNAFDWVHIQMIAQNVVSLVIFNQLFIVSVFTFFGSRKRQLDNAHIRPMQALNRLTALFMLKTIWRGHTVSMQYKIRQMRALALFILLNACETWMLTAEL